MIHPVNHAAAVAQASSNTQPAAHKPQQQPPSNWPQDKVTLSNQGKAAAADQDGDKK